MSHNFSDAHNSASDFETIRQLFSSKYQNLRDEEILFVLTAQEILCGQVPSLQEIDIEDQQFCRMAQALWRAREHGGVPKFWEQFDMLITSRPFLIDWKTLIDPVLFPYVPQSSSTDSLMLEADQSEEPGVLLSQVQPEAVEWLWKPVIPLGKITLLDGDPGTGKSLLLCDLAACLSRGWPMPNGTSGLEGGVVIIAPEDGLSDTIQPRIERAGAELERVVCLNMVEETDGESASKRPFLLTQDIDLLEAAIKRVQAKMLIIDPLMAVLGKSFSQRDGDIRALLAPLQRLVERLHIACVLVRHLTKKGSENILYRGSGSIALLALARCGLITAPDPQDESRMILAQSKNNLGPLAQSFVYRIQDDEETQGDVRPYIRWEGPSPITARHLCSPASMPVTLGTGRQTILALLQEHREAGLTPQQVAEKLPDMSIYNIRKTLKRMAENGQISQPTRGVYSLFSA